LNKPVITTGKRKRAIARATLSQGSGLVTINGMDINVISPDIIKMKTMVPLMLAAEAAKKVDVRVRVNGGGVASRAEASALAIAKALSKHDKKLEKIFLSYDRQLLVADVRRKEARKPNRHGKSRSKVQKSYR